MTGYLAVTALATVVGGAAQLAMRWIRGPVSERIERAYDQGWEDCLAYDPIRHGSRIDRRAVTSGGPIATWRQAAAARPGPDTSPPGSAPPWQPAEDVTDTWCDRVDAVPAGEREPRPAGNGTAGLAAWWPWARRERRARHRSVARVTKAASGVPGVVRRVVRLPGHRVGSPDMLP